MRRARWAVLYGKEEYTEGVGGAGNGKAECKIKAKACQQDCWVAILVENHRKGGKECRMTVRYVNAHREAPMGIEEFYPSAEVTTGEGVSSREHHIAMTIQTEQCQWEMMSFYSMLRSTVREMSSAEWNRRVSTWTAACRQGLKSTDGNWGAPILVEMCHRDGYHVTYCCLISECGGFQSKNDHTWWLKCTLIFILRQHSCHLLLTGRFRQCTTNCWSCQH